MGSPSSDLGRIPLTGGPFSPHTRTVIRIIESEGGELVARDERPRVHPDDRTCIEPSCTTKLSRYNSERTCFLHDEVQRRASFFLISASRRRRGNSLG
jgi:hypothetical protein